MPIHEFAHLFTTRRSRYSRRVRSSQIGLTALPPFAFGFCEVHSKPRFFLLALHCPWLTIEYSHPQLQEKRRASRSLPAMPADTNAGGPPTLNLAGLQVPYSLISLVTLTVQNSALTILLHYVWSSLLLWSYTSCHDADICSHTHHSLAQLPMRSPTLQRQLSCSTKYSKAR